MPRIEYAGRCHCGAIGCRYTTAQKPADWSVRACQCRFCRRHDALSTSDPDGQLQIIVNDAVMLQRYRFALMTADFLLCRNCGVYTAAVIESDVGRFGIINTHVLSPTPDRIAVVTPISYEDENLSERIIRREQRWTPVTEVPWQ
ncbi:MAG: aldehyde-activating protein [Proteobacteria bacterium]|nr:aldehyde-activating protein [Pseudomonadota bacterium]